MFRGRVRTALYTTMSVLLAPRLDRTRFSSRVNSTDKWILSAYRHVTFAILFHFLRRFGVGMGVGFTQ